MGRKNKFVFQLQTYVCGQENSLVPKFKEEVETQVEVNGRAIDALSIAAYTNYETSEFSNMFISIFFIGVSDWRIKHYVTR